MNYHEFGTLLKKLRIKMGIENQADLAKLLGIQQQTVSRWEKGTSRPKAEQIHKIAVIFQQKDPEYLLSAAGYFSQKAVASFVTPFLLEALSPDNFERFCLYFLKYKYPDAKVNRFGDQGHEQEGLDIEVIFPNSTYFTFQCKRHAEFGAAKVKTAVKKHVRQSDKKVILLSRTASSSARDEIKKYKDWELWDKEDISFEIRSLPKEIQIRIVDDFFRGQRMALLGETEIGPWQICEEFFMSFNVSSNVFNHAWSFKGRENEVKDILNDLKNPNIIGVCIYGKGGVGKTRILKEIVEQYQKENENHIVRFLSVSQEITKKSLEDLGRHPKLLIIDDAHNQSNLALLFQISSDASLNIKILIATRQFGVNKIKHKANNLGLCESFTYHEIPLLSSEQAIFLAQQTLKELGGPIQVAEDLELIASGNSLLIVIGAFLVSKRKLIIRSYMNNACRDLILSRFQNEIAGNLGSATDSENIKKLLRIIALIQPIKLENELLKLIANSLENIPTHDVDRCMNLLNKAGVLVKQGPLYRLSPELLGDFINEENCLGMENCSTGYAEKVFEYLSPNHFENYLLNLGKLDWQLGDGKAYNLNTIIWKKFEYKYGINDLSISIIGSTAYFQPKRTIELIERLIKEERFLNKLPLLAKNSAYNFEYLPQACHCLWELANNYINPTCSESAFRFLKELCSIEHNKNINYNKTVIDYCCSLLDAENSWNRKYSPFDILIEFLRTEGYSTQVNDKTITFKPFLVSFQVVAPLRNHIIDKAILFLSHPNPKIGVKAADLLQESLRYPAGLFNTEVPDNVRDAWTEEFICTLKKIHNAVITTKINFVVLTQIIHSISWHAFYAKEKTESLASEIINSLPTCLAFRATRIILDGLDHIVNQNLQMQDDSEKTELEQITRELIRNYQGENLRCYIEEILNNIAAANLLPKLRVLGDNLILEDFSLAQSIVMNSIKNPDSATVELAGPALAEVLKHDWSKGTKYGNQFLNTGSKNLLTALGRAYSASHLKRNFEKADIEILEMILKSDDEWVLMNALEAIEKMLKNDRDQGIRLLKEVNLDASYRVREQVFYIIHNKLTFFKKEDIEDFFERNLDRFELEGIWIENFLAEASFYFPVETATFFMKRAELALEKNDWRYRPCNIGGYSHIPLRFKETSKMEVLPHMFRNWLKLRSENPKFREIVSNIFAAMFFPYNDYFLQFLLAFVEEGGSSDGLLIAKILSKVESNFIMDHHSFVIEIFRVSTKHGQDVIDALCQSLKITTPPKEKTNEELNAKKSISNVSFEDLIQSTANSVPISLDNYLNKF